MIPTCAPPRALSRAPELKLPPDACDSHCHIFGPTERFPFAQSRTYTPPEAPLTRLRDLHERLGIGRAVLVQPACYGSDNSAILAAIRAHPETYRGVALVDDACTRADLERLDRAGMRGIRLNFVSHLGPAPKPLFIERIAPWVRELGWHLVVHVDARDLSALPTLLGLQVPIVIDHLGRVNAGEGINGAGTMALFKVLQNPNCWMKVSGVDRISRIEAPYQDGIAIARAFADSAPDRVLWGTDWPHPNHLDVPDDALLVDLIAEIQPDQELRERMLVDNPARLYGFGTSKEERE